MPLGVNKQQKKLFLRCDPSPSFSAVTTGSARSAVTTSATAASLQLTDFTLKLVHLLLVGRQLIVVSREAVSLVPMRLAIAIKMPDTAILQCECTEFCLQVRELLRMCLRHLY